MQSAYFTASADCGLRKKKRIGKKKGRKRERERERERERLNHGVVHRKRTGYLKTSTAQNHSHYHQFSCLLCHQTTVNYLFCTHAVNNPTRPSDTRQTYPHFIQHLTGESSHLGQMMKVSGISFSAFSYWPIFKASHTVDYSNSLTAILPLITRGKLISNQGKIWVGAKSDKLFLSLSPSYCILWVIWNSQVMTREV